MLLNLLVIGFLLFSSFKFIEGVRIAINFPVSILVALFDLIFLYLVTLLPSSHLLEMRLVNGSLLEKICVKKLFRITLGFFLLVLSVGNFIYANKYVGTPITKGAEYIEPVVLGLAALFLLIKVKPQSSK